MLIVAIWPVFALICIGYLMARRNWPGAGFWPAAESLNYFLLFPALLLSSLAQAPLHSPELPRLGAAAAVLIVAAVAVLMVGRWLRPMPPARFGPAVQGVVRFNTYLALAVLSVLATRNGLAQAAVYLAVAVPLVNVLAVVALSGGVRPWPILRAVFANPLIMACVAGFGLAYFRLSLPPGGLDLLRLLGQGSLPLGLLCVGAALRPSALRGDGMALLVLSGLRLAAMPLAAMMMAQAFGLGQTATLVLVVFSAVPTAPTAYVLTRKMGGDGTLMAGLVTAQTLAAMASVPLVLGLLGFG